MRYFLDCDEDCHYYLVPVEKTDEWYRWREDIDDYWSWESPRPGSGEPEPKLPEGVISLGCSFTCVTFTDPKW